MRYKDFYKSLLCEDTQKWNSNSLVGHLVDNYVHNYSGFLYHGTPPDGLLSMLTDGIYGTQHGEISEYETLSTSTNQEVLRLFSEVNGYTGLTFKVDNIRVLVLNEIMGHLLSRQSGSGMEFNFDETEYETFCKHYNIPKDNRDFYLPFNFMSDIKGIDAWCHEYAWDRIDNPRNMDESEICFIGESVDKLNNMIYDITVDGEVYDVSEKEKAVEELKDKI